MRTKRDVIKILEGDKKYGPDASFASNVIHANHGVNVARRLKGLLFLLESGHKVVARCMTSGQGESGWLLYIDGTPRSFSYLDGVL